MPSLINLEAEYSEMTSRNIQTTAWTCLGLDNKKCLAISTLGDWSLEPYSWARFMKWLAPLMTDSILYTPSPNEHQGQLHWTLQQCQPFMVEHVSIADIDYTLLNPVFEALRGVELVYRGLSVTSSGLVLKGFPATEIQYQNILRARGMLPDVFRSMGLDYREPYANTICHATVLRWKNTPTDKQIQYISDSIHTWDECVFARLKPRNWILGHLTLRVREGCTLLQSYHAPKYIAHRGLMDGPNGSIENTVDLLESNSKAGITSECDIWYKDEQFWLGHDTPDHMVSFEWICKMKEFLLIHAKDLTTFHVLKRIRDQEGIDLHIFYHTDEDVVVTTHGECIVYPGLQVYDGWMSMMPERAPLIKIGGYAAAVCSDYHILNN